MKIQPKMIVAARKKAGLTQQQLAAKIGVSFATINYWENGKTKPSPMAENNLISYFSSIGVFEMETIELSKSNAWQNRDLFISKCRKSGISNEALSAILAAETEEELIDVIDSFSGELYYQNDGSGDFILLLDENDYTEKYSGAWIQQQTDAGWFGENNVDGKGLYNVFCISGMRNELTTAAVHALAADVVEYINSQCKTALITHHNKIIYDAAGRISETQSRTETVLGYQNERRARTEFDSTRPHIDDSTNTSIEFELASVEWDSDLKKFEIVESLDYKQAW